MSASVAAESSPSDPTAVPQWRRSSYCANGACIEVATDGPRVGIRDSKAPAAGELWLSPVEFRAFIAAVRDENYG
ncbi:hypothetical protein GCM10009557_02060 [Virgisporangium ochraceum]|uniref:DUF397 domain-containing protein n=1 Tax=Virgisporangium ochraceum TaxID=65505 RepID=A0A8J3ZUZ2_9ACTN|nr:DUF397 domain-containing protein [Virgisporangium ochraceum]GIJ70141.1 hypothetical protein Voc01_050580 [Virgisporangium ochraceum]